MKKQTRNKTRNKNFWQQKPRTRVCKCGATQKLKTRSTYSHGKKSKATKTEYFKCDRCRATSSSD